MIDHCCAYNQTLQFLNIGFVSKTVYCSRYWDWKVKWLIFHEIMETKWLKFMQNNAKAEENVAVEYQKEGR